MNTISALVLGSVMLLMGEFVKSHFSRKKQILATQILDNGGTRAAENEGLLKSIVRADDLTKAGSLTFMSGKIISIISLVCMAVAR